MARGYVAPPAVDVLTAFLDALTQAGEAVPQYKTAPIVVSIDPGATGAIGLMCRKHYAVTDIPNLKIGIERRRTLSKAERAKTGKKTRTIQGVTTKPDLAGIKAFFNALKDVKARVVVVLEDIPISLGPKCSRHGEIMINRAYAMWPLFLYYLGYEVVNLRPSDWKVAVGLKGRDKNASRALAMTIFPKADMPLAEHHDRAEALLMAHVVQQRRKGGMTA